MVVVALFSAICAVAPEVIAGAVLAAPATMKSATVRLSPVERVANWTAALPPAPSAS